MEVSKREFKKLIKKLEWQGIPVDTLIYITHTVICYELVMEVHLNTRGYPNFYLQL